MPISLPLKPKALNWRTLNGTAPIGSLVCSGGRLSGSMAIAQGKSPSRFAQRLDYDVAVYKCGEIDVNVELTEIPLGTRSGNGAHPHPLIPLHQDGTAYPPFSESLD